MSKTLSIADLEKRWENTLAATETVVVKNPDAYREIKMLIRNIVSKTLDIGDYLPTAERLHALLQTMDAETVESIFHFFGERVSPVSISNLKFFRFECMDLHEKLKAFDAWRLKSHHLEVIK